MEHRPDGPVFHPEIPAYPVHIVVQERRIIFYLISEQELDQLGSLSNSVNLTFLGLSFGGLILGIVLLTIPRSQDFYPIFAALYAVSVVLTAYFGIQAGRDYRRAGERLRQIKAQRLG